MSTARSVEMREKARERRLKHMKSEGKRRQALKDPLVELNPDQRALRRVLEVDFFGNRELMGEAVGMTSGGIAKYVHRGESSPDYDLMVRVAQAVYSTPDQLRAEAAGHRNGIYIVSEDRWIDPDSLSEEERLRIIRLLTLPGEIDPETEL